MKTLTPLILSLIVAIRLVALAEASEIPQTVLQNLAKDLAELQQAVIEAQREQQVGSPTFSTYPWEVVITTPSSDVRAGAALQAASVFKAMKGQNFGVIDKAGDWYAIKLAHPAGDMTSGWLNATDVVPFRSPAPKQAGSPAETIFQSLTEKAANLKRSYESNPYVSITGFSVNLLPPSLSINFEFKKASP